MKPLKSHRLIRIADAFLPATLLIVTLLGRDAIATDLFLALMLVRLLALASSTGLRAAFALQPSMRYAQGSAAVALIAQVVGAAVALPVFGLFHSRALPLIAAGLLLNIEHVFYEYMYAEGDGNSAILSRGITAALILTGLLLSCPPGRGMADPSIYAPVYLIVTSALAALVALAIGLSMGGSLRAKLNLQVLKIAPMSLLQAALYPGLALLLTLYSGLDVQTCAPLFAGLILYELMKTPFRRTPAEALPMNKALRILCGVCVIALIPFVAGFKFPGDVKLLNDVPYFFGALLLAAACAFALYGNIQKKENNE